MGWPQLIMMAVGAGVGQLTGGDTESTLMGAGMGLGMSYMPGFGGGGAGGIPANAIGGSANLPFGMGAEAAGGGGMLSSIGGTQGLFSLVGGGANALSVLGEGAAANQESKFNEGKYRLEAAQARTRGMQDSYAMLSKNNVDMGALLASRKGWLGTGSNEAVLRSARKIGRSNLESIQFAARSRAASALASAEWARSSRDKQGLRTALSLIPVAAQTGAGVMDARASYDA